MSVGEDRLKCKNVIIAYKFTLNFNQSLGRMLKCFGLFKIFINIEFIYKMDVHLLIGHYWSEYVIFR